MLSATPMLVIKLSGLEDSMSNLNVEWPGSRPRTKKEYFGVTLASEFGNFELRLQEQGKKATLTWRVMRKG